MRGRWLGAALTLLATVIVGAAFLGPFGLGAIEYRTSATTMNQIVGGDAAALLIVAPFTLFVAVLAFRRHPAAPVLALAPGAYVVYTYAQLIVGQEYLRLPGNNERYFPLLLAGFVLAGAVAVGAWAAVDVDGLPRMSNGLRRSVAGVLLLIGVYLVVGLHLSSLMDAWRDHPLRTEYLSSPTPFWLVKLMDLGIIAPVAIVTAVLLLRRHGSAVRAAYAVVGAYTLLAYAVTAMGAMMLWRSDPDASAALVAAFAMFALALSFLSITLYRPLFRAIVPAGPAEKSTAANRDLTAKVPS